MLKLTSIEGNRQRLDGGAMFGNAPRALWSKWMTPDAENRISLACRGLLIETDDKKILLETGVGNFFEPKLKDRFGVVENDHVLLASLAEVGLSDADIDVVVLSHLHFDHAGGLLSPYEEGKPHSLLFPNARFVVSAAAWERALHPHPRDRASFVPELNALLEACGRLEVVDGSDASVLGQGFSFRLSDGHTPGLLLTEVAMPDGPVLFGGDLIPGTPWVHVPITMGYDRFPEKLIDEKQTILEELARRGGRVFFTHDDEIALARIIKDEKGRFSVENAETSISALQA